MKAPASPEAVLASHRIAVCVGSGGVGKTTLAAALGLAAARMGKRTLVLTIDPARRLADALGVEALGNDPHPIPRATLDALGVPPEGELSAMMLDMKRTFDDLVERFADGEETRQRILTNPIYQHVSDALAGSAEYSAMEKVFEISERDDLDLIVLDTPPSQHALDFLEAPERLMEFLDSRLVQLLLHPAMSAGRFSLRLFHRGAHQIFRLLERVSGISFLEDISEFLLAFEGMSEGFRERAHKVRGLLFGPKTAFLLAAGPADESVVHASALLDQLEEGGARIAGLILNRVRVWPDGEPRVPGPDEREPARAALRQALAEAGSPAEHLDAAADATLEVLARYAAMVRRDDTAIAPLLERAQKKGYFFRRIPEFSRDVHDLESLVRVADFVCDERNGENVEGAASGETR